MHDRFEHRASVLVFRTVVMASSWQPAPHHHTTPPGTGTASHARTTLHPLRLTARTSISQNVAMPAAHNARLKLIAPSASPEEAAAVVAALERFIRATAPLAVAPERPFDQWQRTAILEGVEREAQGDLRDPWLGS